MSMPGESSSCQLPNSCPWLLLKTLQWLVPSRAGHAACSSAAGSFPLPAAAAPWDTAKLWLLHLDFICCLAQFQREALREGVQQHVAAFSSLGRMLSMH